VSGPHPTGSGLATWRKRKAEEKAVIVRELDKLREQATVEVREGREFRVLKIPQRFRWEAL